MKKITPYLVLVTYGFLLAIVFTACTKSAPTPAANIVNYNGGNGNQNNNNNNNPGARWDTLAIDEINLVDGVKQYKYNSSRQNPDSIALEMEKIVSTTAYYKLLYVQSDGLWYNMPGSTLNNKYTVSFIIPLDPRIPGLIGGIPDVVLIKRVNSYPDNWQKVRMILVPVNQRYLNILPIHTNLYSYEQVRSAFNLAD